VCYPEKGDVEILEQILAGGLSKMVEAGCTVIGGHSIRDEETKFGYSVTGLIHPKQILANKGAQPGDRLLLTKALGTGVISTAIKKGKAKQAWIDGAVKSMTMLNKRASEVIAGAAEDRSALRTSGSTWAVHALTDITGFGLIGHSREMAQASEVGLRIQASRIPLLEGAIECVRAEYIPGGLKANREFAECMVGYEGAISEELKTLLFDPQTAGGLLVSVSAKDAGGLLKALGDAGTPAVEIGEVIPSTKPLILVTG
jgi:selenide,water dikinase